MKKALSLVLSLSLILVISGCAAFRGEGRLRANNLLITGNYFNSRLLCELAQYKSKQPILLFSLDADGVQQLFYLPASGKVTEVAIEDYQDMITFINPRRILVVGDTDYVPQKYVEVARKCNYPMQEVTSSSWDNNAKALGELLNQGRLLRDFQETKQKLASAGFEPSKAD
ncbi:MAG: hypothetical protein GX564_12870 [Oligosphaeraceae bacterium]|nr:hypothetical protein [Oligosphaeraceae bacterium]